MPAGSAAGKLEAELKDRYGSNKHAIYGTLNKAGLMHGNKVTAKGAKKPRLGRRARTAPARLAVH